MLHACLPKLHNIQTSIELPAIRLTMPAVDASRSDIRMPSQCVPVDAQNLCCLAYAEPCGRRYLWLFVYHVNRPLLVHT